MASIDTVRDYDAIQELDSILDGKPTKLRIDNDKKNDDNISLKTMESVCYVVSAICFNIDNKVLLVQQANPHVYEKWYLPSGRLNQDESIVQGCVRIVEKQTGMAVKPKSVILVETGAARWFRFIFYCEITGGELKVKTTDVTDVNEPIMAEFATLKTYMIDKILSSGDIVHQISLAKNWLKADSRLDYIPGHIPYTQITIRLICTTEFRSELGNWNDCYILITNNNSLPAFEIPSSYSFEEIIVMKLNLLLQYDGNINRLVSIEGIVAIDHTGSDGKDGCCFTILIRFKPDVITDNKLVNGRWENIEKDENLKDKIMNAFNYKNIPIQ